MTTTIDQDLETQRLTQALTVDEIVMIRDALEIIDPEDDDGVFVRLQALRKIERAMAQVYGVLEDAEQGI